MKFLNFNTKYPILNYIFLIALSLSVFFSVSILYEVFQIHIYRGDSFYNIPEIESVYKFEASGRWINHIFYPITTLISGKLLSTFMLLSFFYFIFISSYRWSKNFYYAILISLLLFQIPSLYSQIMWPAASVPAFLVLFLSIFFVQRLPIFIFYILFGILFFATMSNFYYLLPLLHLSLLTSNNSKKNFRLLFFKIIPAWAFGFIIGYVVTQLIVYINTGHFIQIKSWRNPHYIHSVYDLTHNILSSLNFLERDIKSIFSNCWIIFLIFPALLIAYKDRKKDLLFLPLILFFLIIIIHYIVMIPVGINIAPRTIIATWVGILAIVFFIPLIKRWQIFFLTPIVVFFTFTLYEKNHNNLHWYSLTSNIHFEKLLKESPKSPGLYNGVVLLATHSDIANRNALISKQYNVHKDSYLEDFDHFTRWVPGAREAGFKSIIMCDGTNESRGKIDHFDKTTDMNLLCQEVSKVYKKNNILLTNQNTFYTILGEYDGRLIISFNENWYH